MLCILYFLSKLIWHNWDNPDAFNFLMMFLQNHVCDLFWSSRYKASQILGNFLQSKFNDRFWVSSSMLVGVWNSKTAHESFLVFLAIDYLPTVTCHYNKSLEVTSVANCYKPINRTNASNIIVLPYNSEQYF